MNTYCVDANIFITAWNVNYPPNIFATLWINLAKHQDNIILIEPIFDEIDPIPSRHKNLPKDKKKEKYPLGVWIEENKFSKTCIVNDSSVQKKSLFLEREYKTTDGPKGASKNDIALIAYAQSNDKIVVTLESEQKQKPKEKSTYKIPLICAEQNVKCINFIEMLAGLSINC